MRALRRLVPPALALALAVAGGLPPGHSGQAAAQSPQELGQARLPSVVGDSADQVLPEPMRGSAALRALGDRVPAIARLNGRSAAALTRLLSGDSTMWLDRSGRLFVKDELHTVEAAPTTTSAASYPLDQTFELHSSPGSTRTIYLDFDGVRVDGNVAWTEVGLPTGEHAGWDPMNDGPTFGDRERIAIQDVWARVAEDFAPFDVDVTTKDPGAAALTRTDPTDQAYGTHLVVTDSDTAWNGLCPRGCGGTAWLRTFGEAETNGRYQLAWVFSSGVSDIPAYVAEAAAHEVGHTLDLTHDGTVAGPDGAAAQTYYKGHAPWAPIMGSSYTRGVTQWSNGGYAYADNKQDDVAVIAGRAPLRTDEAGSSRSTATALPEGPAYVTSRDDVDHYVLGACSGDLTVTARPTTIDADLDVVLTVLRDDGTTLATSAPATTETSTYQPDPWRDGWTYAAPTVTGMDAIVATRVPFGHYYAVVDGGGAQSGGAGDPVADYDDYGSLGAYTLTASGCTPPGVTAPQPPTSLGTTLTAADGLTATWAAPENDGGAALLGYDVSLDGGAPERVLPDVTARRWSEITTGRHTVSVVAVNAAGSSQPASATVRRSVPGLPILYDTHVGTDPAGDPSVQYFYLRWLDPADDGDSTMLRYRVEHEVRPGAWQLVREVAAATASPEPQPYSVGVALPPGSPPSNLRVIGVNEVGDSDPLLVEGQIPGRPELLGPQVSLTVDTIARTLTVVWSDPYDGGSPILGTRLAFLTPTADPYDADYTRSRLMDVSPQTHSVVFSDVPAGQHLLGIEPYNALGGTEQRLGFEMPALPPPDHVGDVPPPAVAPPPQDVVVTTVSAAPRIGAARPGGRGGRTTAIFTWSRPVTTGGSALTGYKVAVVTLKNGRKVGTKAYAVRVSAQALQVALTKRPGITYAARVRARNGVGWSPVSARSKAVVPR